MHYCLTPFINRKTNNMNINETDVTKKIKLSFLLLEKTSRDLPYSW